MNPLSRILWLLTLTALSSTVAGENWPGWRGPRGDGTSLETSVPVRWSAGSNVVWRAPVPGDGHASPIVWGDRIFLVSAAGDDRILLAFDRDDGRLLWRRPVLTSPRERKHSLNSHASSTPATDGRLVYTAFLDRDQMVVAAHRLDGTPHWTVRPGPFQSMHGFSSSPVLFEDRVIVNGDHDGDSYIVALDRETGRVVWKTMRENRTRSYCVPLIRELSGRRQMILSGDKCVASYDPRTGRRHWIIQGPTEQFVASLVYNEKHDLLFLTGGFPELHLLGIRHHGSGDVTGTHVAWRGNRGVSYVPSPLSHGDHFFIVSDGGIASCYEAATGRQMWQERLGGDHHASLVSANGLIYFLSDAGRMTVVKAAPQFEIVAVNELGEECMASPAISGGRLYLRGANHLFCLADK